MAQSDTTTGTAAGSSTTFTDLIDRARLLLNDESSATWDNELIATFLNDAIQDYSQHFPRTLTTTISMTTGTPSYSLPLGLQSVIDVEYPTGQTPPARLSRLPLPHADFWHAQSWYDFRLARSAATAATIWFSAPVATGESAAVTYQGDHAIMEDPAAPTGTNSVPPAHQPLLLKYVLWSATNHLLMKEQQAPSSNSSLLMAQLSQDAGRFERAYQTAVRQALFAADGESSAVQWITPGHDLARIY